MISELAFSEQVDESDYPQHEADNGCQDEPNDGECDEHSSDILHVSISLKLFH